jgi:two-component system, NtrC family, response regulator AtoC
MTTTQPSALVTQAEPPLGWSVTERLGADGYEVIKTSARPYGLERIVGASAAMTALRHLVARVAIRPAPTVLLSGKRGTGKALIAKVIHDTSDRAAQPFMQITRVTSPEQLLDSGLLAMAHGGTVFLDDISLMVPTLQARLLQFFGDGRFDVRLIAATRGEVEADSVPANALPITLPPLRSHTEDIPLLVEHFIETCNGEFDKRVVGSTPAVYTLLQAYSWPGNVRELRNVIERAMLLTDRDHLDADDFPVLTHANEFELPADGIDLEDVERAFLIQALRRCNGNQTRAGSLLGLNRDQIRYRIEKFGLAAAQLTH